MNWHHAEWLVRWTSAYLHSFFGRGGSRHASKLPGQVDQRAVWVTRDVRRRHHVDRIEYFASTTTSAPSSRRRTSGFGERHPSAKTSNPVYPQRFCRRRLRHLRAKASERADPTSRSTPMHRSPWKSEHLQVDLVPVTIHRACHGERREACFARVYTPSPGKWSGSRVARPRSPSP